MNIEHVNQWLDDLTNGDHPQASGYLCVLQDDEATVEGWCCLGRVEALAGTAFEVLDTAITDGGQPYRTYVTETDAAGLALTEAGMEWLGVLYGDPQLDCQVAPLGTTDNQGWYPTCSSLNDNWGLTFPQIADMVRYFGLIDSGRMDRSNGNDWYLTTYPAGGE